MDDLTITASPKWYDPFLVVLSETGSVSEACRRCAISRQTAYNYRESDSSFAALWAYALEDSADALEREARRRAMEGWEEPVFYQGEATGVIRKYSDALLALLLKANAPAKFRENVSLDARHDVTVNGRVEYVYELEDNGMQAEGDSDGS